MAWFWAWPCRFLRLLVFVEIDVAAVDRGEIGVVGHGQLAVGGLADHGAAGEALQKLIDG